MAKGYWVAHLVVKDPEGFKTYQAANAEPIRAHGGRFLIRGGAADVKCGSMKARHVVLEFPTIEAARACYASAGYQAAYQLLQKYADVDFVIVEGYDG